MSYLAFIIVDGALTGAVYALFALAFVIVYRTAGVINFALGEWAALGTVLLSFFAGTMGLHGTAAFAAAAVMIVTLTFVFARVVLAPLIGRPVVAIVMVTLGLAATLRGAMALLFRGTPRTMPFEIPRDSIAIAGIEIATARVVVAAIAAATVATLGAFLHRSRTGLALRALAADPQAAMASGINVERYVALAWALAGVVCLAAGVLWAMAQGPTPRQRQTLHRLDHQFQKRQSRRKTRQLLRRRHRRPEKRHHQHALQALHWRIRRPHYSRHPRHTGHTGHPHHTHPPGTIVGDVPTGSPTPPRAVTPVTPVPVVVRSTVNIEAVSAAATEGANATTGVPIKPAIAAITGLYRITRTVPFTAALTVQVIANNSSTANPSDYTLTPAADAVVTIPAGAGSVTVTLNPLTDSLIEPDETVTLTLGESTEYLLGTATSATVRIQNTPVQTP